MTAGTIDQKAAKTDVAKWEALVLDTAQFYDRAERLLNSKSNRSPRKKIQTQKEIGLLGAIVTLRKIAMPIIQVVLLGKHIGAPSKKGLGGAMYVPA